MYPILIQLGSFTVLSLWIFISIGFFVALLIMLKLVKKSRLKVNFLAEYSLSIFLSGIIIARLVFVIKNFQYYFIPFSAENALQTLYIWDKGLSLWGGLIGALCTMAFFAWRQKENVLRWLDIFTASIMGALVLGNVGALLDGINFGNETTLPWGIVLENSIYAVPIHPVQAYAAIYCLIITVVLYLLFSKKIGKKEGNIALIGFGSYSFMRFLEDFFRGDESNLFFGIRESQIYTLLIFLICCILFYVTNFTNFKLFNNNNKKNEHTS